MTDTDIGKAPMDATRKAALVAGLLYVGTFVFSIPALRLFGDVLDDPDFVLGSGAGQGVLWGGLGEVLLAFCCVGTAVVLYPVLERYGPGRAIGFVASRTLEAAMILVGVLAVLSIHTLRQEPVGTAGTALTTAASALVAVKDGTFLLGPGVMPAINALCFATIVYRSRLVPRWIPMLGLIGAPSLLASSTAALFGVIEQVSVPALLMALPIAAWELSVGVYMIVKGFRIPKTAGDDTRVLPFASATRAHARSGDRIPMPGGSERSPTTAG